MTRLLLEDKHEYERLVMPAILMGMGMDMPAKDLRILFEGKVNQPWVAG